MNHQSIDQSNTQRIYWFDIVRVIAITLVIFTHVHEALRINDIFLKSLFYSIDRIGVPLFFMLSAALLLPREIPNIGKFYKKRIPQFIFLIFFYSVLTSTITLFGDGMELKEALSKAIKNYNGLYPANNGSAIHLWFMYTIIGLYLIAPFLGKLLNKLSTKEILLFLLLSLLVSQLKETLIILTEKPVLFNFINRVGYDFFGAYLNFYLIGYLIVNRNIHISNLHATALLIFPILGNVLFETHINNFINGLHWYSSSLSIVLSSIGAFILCRNTLPKIKRKITIIESIAKYSFGIYLSHVIFIYLLNKSIPINNLTIKITLLFTCSFITSYLFTALLSKSRFTKFLVI